MLLDLIEARVVASRLPGARPLPLGLSLVVRRRGTRWHLEASLDEDVFPVAMWLRDERILDELGEGACLAIEALPRGDVALELQASRASVDRFLEWIQECARETRVRKLPREDKSAPELTQLQADALRRAAALGYYRVPRAIHLSALAAKLHVSPAALSERLRRGEARLVMHYVAQEDAVDRSGDG